jgi:hypothetical protein
MWLPLHFLVLNFRPRVSTAHHLCLAEICLGAGNAHPTEFLVFQTQWGKVRHGTSVLTAYFGKTILANVTIQL